MSGSTELEAFMDESLRQGVKKGYNQPIFMRMRTRHGTVEAMKKLVVSSEIQSGFQRMKEIGLLDWTVEAAILKFPDEFTFEDRDAAKWRLEQATKETP